MSGGGRECRMHALGRPQTCRPPALRGAAAAGQRRRPRGPAAREGCMSLCCARSGGLTPHGARRAGGGAAAVAACRDLLAHFEVTADQFQVGRTKLFFRAGVLGRLEDAAARINRHARARPPARPAACAACAGGAAATAAVDAWALPCSSISKAPPRPACCRVRGVTPARRAVLCIQATERMLRVRRAFVRLRAAAVVIQARARCPAPRERAPCARAPWGRWP